MKGGSAGTPSDAQWRVLCWLAGATVILVLLGLWVAAARVIGRDPRFLLLSLLFFALIGAVAALIYIQRTGMHRRAGGSRRVLDRRDLRRLSPRRPPRTVCRAVEEELQRLRCRDRLDLEVWRDGRCRIACSTGMRVLRCEDLEITLRRLPDGASWKTVWRELFDFPEAPV